MLEVQQMDRNLSGLIKNVFICFSKINFRMTRGWAILFFEWARL